MTCFLSTTACEWTVLIPLPFNSDANNDFYLLMRVSVTPKYQDYFNSIMLGIYQVIRLKRLLNCFNLFNQSLLSSRPTVLVSWKYPIIIPIPKNKSCDLHYLRPVGIYSSHSNQDFEDTYCATCEKGFRRWLRTRPIWISTKRRVFSYPFMIIGCSAFMIPMFPEFRSPHTIFQRLSIGLSSIQFN